MDLNKIRLVFFGMLVVMLPFYFPYLLWGDDALEIYTDAGNFQNNKIFDLAVDEWERFLRDFPEHELARKAHYYLGVCWFQLKQYEAALGSFQLAIEHPHNGDFELLEDSYLNLGSTQVLLARTGKPEMYARAVDTYTKLMKVFPKDRGKHTDQALYFLGDAFHAQGNPKKATVAYARVINEFPKSPLRADSIYALAVTLDEQKQFDNAMKYYDLYVREFPKQDFANDARMGKAEILVRMKKYAEAAKEYAPLVDSETFISTDFALLRQALCNWHLGQFDEAARLYSLVANFPQSEHAKEATLMVGRSLFRAGKHDEAGNWFQQVVQQDAKNNSEATHWLCRIHLQNENPGGVLELTEQLLQGTSKGAFHVELMLDRADALYELPERRSEALELYFQIHQQYAEHKLRVQALYNAAFTAMELGKYDDGFAHSSMLLDKYPDHELAPDAQHVSAECKLLSRQYPDAESIYRELIEKNSHHKQRVQWQLRLGLVLFSQKKHEETIALLQPVSSLLEEVTQLVETFFIIGTSYFHLEEWERAAKALGSAVEADKQGPKAAEALLYLARAQRSLGQNENALISLNRIINEFPNSRILDQTFYWFAEISYAVDQFESAAQTHQALVKRWPDSDYVPHALSGWGWSSYRMEKYEIGVEAFSELITHFSQHDLVSEARYGRALCQRKLEAHDKAIRDFDHYLASQPTTERSSNALYLRGLSLIDANRYDEAADSLERLLREHPKYHSVDGAKYQLAWAYKLLNERSQAVQTFESLVADYPNSSHVSEARYHLGENLYWHEHDYAKAFKEYRECQETSKQSDIEEKASYMMAWCCYQLEQFDRAVEFFGALVKKHPVGTHHLDALFMRAEAMFKMEDYEQALDAYRQVKGKTGLSEERIILTLLHGGQAAGQLEKWEESLKWLQPVDAEHSDSPYVVEALFEQGIAMFSLGRAKIETGDESPLELDKSLSLFQSAANRSRDVVGARSRFRVGEVYFQKKMFQDAIRQYQRVMYGYGGDKAPDEIKPWQANAGFQAGQAALILAGEADDGGDKKRHIREAKKCFSFIVEKHPKSELVSRAVDRLKQL